MLHSGQLSDAIRECLLDLTQRLHKDVGDDLLEVRLFGSQARGEARPDSDVDVLVLVTETSVSAEKRVCAIAADVGLDYDLVLGVLVWDAEHLRKHEQVQTLMLQNIQSQGVVLWTHP